MATLTAATRADALRTQTQAADGWRQLYRISALAALGVIALIPVQVLVFVLWPTPASAADAFALFQANALGGLLSLDLLLMASWAMSLVAFLGLAAALWKAAPARIAVAVVLEVAAFTMYFSSNTAFSMLGLSEAHASAATDAARAAYLGAGEAMLALYTGTAYDVGYVLSGVAVLLAGLAVLRTPAFARATGYAMVAYAVMQVPATAGEIGMALGVSSLVPMIAWLVLVARGLLTLARDRIDA